MAQDLNELLDEMDVLLAEGRWGSSTGTSTGTGTERRRLTEQAKAKEVSRSTETINKEDDLDTLIHEIFEEPNFEKDTFVSQVL